MAGERHLSESWLLRRAGNRKRKGPIASSREVVGPALLSPCPFSITFPPIWNVRVATGSYLLSLPKMLSGANAFEISDIERMNIEGASAGGLGRNNVTCPVVTRNNNSPGTGGGPDFKVR